MMCGHAKELIAASWTGELDTAQEAKLKQHLTGCADCTAEMTQLSAMWERLADLPAPEPSHALAVRWESTLGIAHRCAASAILEVLAGGALAGAAGVAGEHRSRVPGGGHNCGLVRIRRARCRAWQRPWRDCDASRRSGQHQRDGGAFSAAAAIGRRTVYAASITAVRMRTMEPRGRFRADSGSQS